MEFYSNCFIEVIKAKIRNPKIIVMYLPAFLNEVHCPHWMWMEKMATRLPFFWEVTLV